MVWDTGYPVKGVQFGTEWILTASRGHFFHYCQCVFVIGFKVPKKGREKLILFLDREMATQSELKDPSVWSRDSYI